MTTTSQPDTGNQHLRPESHASTLLVPYYPERELGLRDLSRAIRRRRVLIAGLVAVVTIGTALVGVVRPRRYRAQSVLLPPGFGDVQALNLTYGGDGIHSLAPDQAYERVLLHLSSRSLQRELFDRFEIAKELRPKAATGEEVQAVFDGEFRPHVRIERMPGAASLVELEFAVAPALLVTWTNGLVRAAESAVVEEFSARAQHALEARRVLAANSIGTSRAVAHKHQTDEIARLREAASIATELGISEPQIPLSGWLGAPPAYMRGSRVLEQEIRVLTERKDFDPFAPNLRELEEQLSGLNNIEIDREGVRAVLVDQPAALPLALTGPSTLRRVGLALLASLALGVAFAVVRYWLEEVDTRDLYRPTGTADSGHDESRV